MSDTETISGHNCEQTEAQLLNAWNANRNLDRERTILRGKVAALEGRLEIARARITELETERDRISSGAKTLGSIVDRQCRDVLAATGLHDLIDEDGDGDWGLVWERLAEMGADRAEELVAIAEKQKRDAASVEEYRRRYEDALTEIGDKGNRLVQQRNQLRAYRDAMRDVRRILTDFGITNAPPRLAALLKEGTDE